MRLSLIRKCYEMYDKNDICIYHIIDTRDITHDVTPVVVIYHVIGRAYYLIISLMTF